MFDRNAIHNEGASFEVFIFFVGKRGLLSSDPLVGQFLDLSLGHFGFLGLEGEGLDQVEVGVTGEGAEDPEEGLFVLVVRLGGDVEVLEVALSVEGDLAGLDLPVLLVDLVSDQDDGDVVADPGEILVPLGDVLVGDSGGDVEHHDGRMGPDVVSFTETSQLFLAGSVPEGQTNGPVVGVEGDGADLDSLGGDVFLFKLTGDVPLDEGGLAHTSVSEKDDLELSNNFRRLHVIIVILKS